MEQELEKIIRDKNYAELSAEDRFVLSDLIHSEEEFDVVKQIFATAPSLNDGIAPSPKLKASLMETFTAQHAAVVSTSSKVGARKTKIIFFRSVAAVAAIFILFILLFPFGDDNGESKLTADNQENRGKVANSSEESQIETNEIEERDSIENPEIESIAQVQESSVQVAVNNYRQRTSPPNLNRNEPFMDDQFSSSANYFEETTHSDRLSSSDLGDQSKQVVQDNPALLDVLYTAF